MTIFLHDSVPNGGLGATPPDRRGAAEAVDRAGKPVLLSLALMLIMSAVNAFCSSSANTCQAPISKSLPMTLINSKSARYTILDYIARTDTANKAEMSAPCGNANLPCARACAFRACVRASLHN